MRKEQMPANAATLPARAPQTINHPSIHMEMNPMTSRATLKPWNTVVKTIII
jgi:hypothetical protein